LEICNNQAFILPKIWLCDVFLKTEGGTGTLPVKFTISTLKIKELEKTMSIIQMLHKERMFTLSPLTVIDLEI